MALSQSRGSEVAVALRLAEPPAVHAQCLNRKDELVVGIGDRAVQPYVSDGERIDGHMPHICSKRGVSPTLVEHAFDAFLQPFAVGLLPVHQKTDCAPDRLLLRILGLQQRNDNLSTVSHAPPRQCTIAYPGCLYHLRAIWMRTPGAGLAALVRFAPTAVLVLPL